MCGCWGVMVVMGCVCCVECVQILLKHGAMVKAKNNKGWNCLEEAVSYGDRQTS